MIMDKRLLADFHRRRPDLGSGSDSSFFTITPLKVGHRISSVERNLK
jgi:hypothetical protein